MIIAVLDADVLFPMHLRDTLLRLASAGCFRLHWSERILDEVTRNLVSHHRMAQGDADRLEAKLRATFPEAMVSNWEALEGQMRNHPKDRHVAAAAAAIHANVVVTSNIRDFRRLPDGLTAMTPDEFLTHLLETQTEEVLETLAGQALGYRNPPATAAELLEWLSKRAPTFATRASQRRPDRARQP